MEDAEDARRSRSLGARHRLLKGTDARKDQSYVLFTLTQTELGRPPPANRRVPQGDCPMDRRRGRAARGRQARQPGDMLHLGRRLPEIRRRQNARGSGGT